MSEATDRWSVLLTCPRGGQVFIPRMDFDDAFETAVFMREIGFNAEPAHWPAATEPKGIIFRAPQTHVAKAVSREVIPEGR